MRNGLDIQVLCVSPGHLLSLAGSQNLMSLSKALRECAAKSPACDAIILYQEPSSLGGDERFVAEVFGDLLADLLENRLRTLRSLILLVRNSEIPIYYVTRSHVFNERWELALACRGILAYSKGIYVGFPQLEYEHFPAGGIFEACFASDRKSLNLWIENPVISIEQAVVNQHVQFVIDGTEPLQESERWIRKELNRSSSMRQKSIDVNSRGIGSFFFGRSVHPFRQVTQEWPGSVPAGSPLSQCLNLLTKADQTSDQNREEILAVAARQYFRAQYLSEYFKEILLHPPKGKQSNSSVAVMIDVDELLVPGFIIHRLLVAGNLVVLTASSLASLRRGVQVIHSKLSRHAPRNIDEIWKNVNWGIGLDCPTEAYFLKSRPNFSFSVSRGRRSIELQMVSSQSWHVFKAVCELTQIPDAFQQEFEFLLPCLCDFFVISNPIASNNMCSSIFLKSKIFEILLAEVGECGSFDIIIQSLAEQGWTGVDKVIDWERFLSTRHACYGAVLGEVKVGQIELSAFAWEVSSVKEADALGSSASDLKRRTSYNISEKLGVFIGFFCHLIIEKGIVVREIDAEILCGACIGYPRQWLSPLRWWEKLGDMRRKGLLRKYFPEYSIELF